MSRLIQPQKRLETMPDNQSRRPTNQYAGALPGFNRPSAKQHQHDHAPLKRQTSIRDHMLSTNGESAFAATNQAIQKFDDLKYQLRSTLERNAQSKIRLDRDVAELKKKAEEIYPQLALDDEQVLEDWKQKSKLLRSAEDLIEWIRETIVIHHHNHDSSAREKELTGLLERLMVKYAEIKTQLRG